MSEHMQLIAKNTGISIGLGITFSIFIFLGGLKVGSLEAEFKLHQEYSKKYISKEKVELQIKNLKEDITDIKEMQKIILQELRKKL